MYEMTAFLFDALCSVFTREAIEALTLPEQRVLAHDVREIINDEQRTASDACLVLRTRIGGVRNLYSYVQVLMAGSR